jgi:hypothetical protein
MTAVVQRYPLIRADSEVVPDTHRQSVREQVDTPSASAVTGASVPRVTPATTAKVVITPSFAPYTTSRV